MQVIQADTIDEAAEKILNLLKEDPKTPRGITSRNNVFYFNGWDGLGASAVIRAIARRFTATSKQEPAASAGRSVSAGLEFEQVMHIDCSKWESRRALQRAVAEQLGLPAKVMDMFDKQDDEDDFRGVAQGSRAELQQVVRETYQLVQKLNHGVLMIFHNGSTEEIDLARCCGFPPLAGYSTSKVLWTFQGRFRLKPQAKVESAMMRAGTTDTFLSASTRNKDPHELWSYLVREEAEELVAMHKINTGVYGNINQPPAQVTECFLYMLKLCRRRHQSIDYDLATHGANYWICDGLIKHLQEKERDIDDLDADHGLWRAADALQREMQLDADYHQYTVVPLHLARCIEREPYWTSPTCGIFLLPPTRVIFQPSLDKLISVLKLSHCIFNFPSPPFLCCYNLRFLWLENCQLNEISTRGGAETEDDVIRRCFQRLWVFDVRYTAGCNQILSARMMDHMTYLRELNVMGAQDWDMGQMQGRLPNIRKLRVTKSTTIHCSCSERDLFSGMKKMELLEFSENTTNESMTSLCGPGVGNINNCLETVIVDGCVGLEMISFEGCTNLKNILLSGRLDGLRSLNISGAAMKTLDLTKTTIFALRELYLLDCEKLCAIIWPPKNKRNSSIDRLHLDTMQSVLTNHCGERKVIDFQWYISVRDVRLLKSVEPMCLYNRRWYVEISSTTVVVDASKHENIIEGCLMGDQQKVLVSAQQKKQHADDEGNVEALGISWMWPCPDAPHLPEVSGYMHIQDQRGTITVPYTVTSYAVILHVKDNLSITILPSSTVYGSEWHALQWCKIERCPKLECVFSPPQEYYGSNISYRLRILWASQLPKARCIWNWSEQISRDFKYLTYLHLDVCPRLLHVLPFAKKVLTIISTDVGPVSLKTLEIMWCGDLREVFPLETNAKLYLVEKQPQIVTVGFPKLKRIHLHELPTLHSICGAGTRMSAPELETVVIRGCWSLNRLPTVKKEVRLYCEKDWWDSLQWEDASQKKLYKPIHSKYYKKATLLRGSVLR